MTNNQQITISDDVKEFLNSNHQLTLSEFFPWQVCPAAVKDGEGILVANKHHSKKGCPTKSADPADSMAFGGYTFRSEDRESVRRFRNQMN